MSAAAASATEWNDLQIMQALRGVEEGRWWNIASSALGTCSLARRIECSQDRFDTFVLKHKLTGYNKRNMAAALAAAAVDVVAAADSLIFDFRDVKNKEKR